MKKELILNLFKRGASIDTIASTLFYSAKEKESKKRKDERVKIDRKDIRSKVEQVILEDYLFQIATNSK